MKVSPWLDVWDFVWHGGPLGAIFGVLLVSSVVIAAVNLRLYPEQRTLSHAWNWFVRIAIGGLWWQQSLWKTPPTYGADADGNGGLHFWVEQMVQYASTPLQSHLVENVILKHFALLAPQVYAGEVLVAVLLMLGLFGRVSSIVGALMAVNLWLGLYRSPTEWAWEYFFLVVIQVTFLVVKPGRSWGLDGLMERAPAGRFAWTKVFR